MNLFLLEEKDIEQTIINFKQEICLVAFNDRAYMLNELYIETIASVLQHEFGQIKGFETPCQIGNTLSNKYGIKEIPTILIFKEGNIIGHIIGLCPKSYVESYLAQL